MSEQDETETKRSIYDIFRDSHGLELAVFRAENVTHIVGLRTVNRQKPGVADKIETVRQLVEINVDKERKSGSVFVGGKMVANINGPTNRMIERMWLNAVLYWLNECKRVKAMRKQGNRGPGL